MQVRILGARQGESSGTHFSTALVDGCLALDAGSLTSQLALGEQAAVRAVLLTHRHFDHVKDLGAFGFNRFQRGQVRLGCAAEVRADLEATLLNERIWMNFFERPTAEAPTFVHVPVEAERELTLEGYRVLPVAVPHSVPTLAYEVASPDGGRLLYTGDNGPGAGAAWARATPDVIITEVTYANADSDLAVRNGHLTAELLVQELLSFRKERGYLPRVLVVHVNPYEESRVAAEVVAAAADLSASIALAEEGAVYEVASRA